MTVKMKHYCNKCGYGQNMISVAEAKERSTQNLEAHHPWIRRKTGPQGTHFNTCQ